MENNGELKAAEQTANRGITLLLRFLNKSPAHLIQKRGNLRTSSSIERERPNPDGPLE